MRTSTNFFLFSLAVADIAILLMGRSDPKCQCSNVDLDKRSHLVVPIVAFEFDYSSLYIFSL